MLKRLAAVLAAAISSPVGASQAMAVAGPARVVDGDTLDCP